VKKFELVGEWFQVKKRISIEIGLNEEECGGASERDGFLSQWARPIKGMRPTQERFLYVVADQ
jgi:hypothetical protein